MVVRVGPSLWLPPEVQERVRVTLEVGDKVWRPVWISVSGKHLDKEPLDDLLIEDSTHPRVGRVKMLRAKFRRSGIWVAQDADEKGVICLTADPIPRDWTYFLVIKRSMNGRAVWVRAVAGDLAELKRKF